MSEFVLDDSLSATMKGRVAVVVGGANGIGAATVNRLYHAGAHVFNGDLDDLAGNELVKDLQQAAGPDDGDVTFTRVDVTDYQAILSLFDAAYKSHGRVDIAIFSSGVTETPGWLTSDHIDLNAVKEVPATLVRLVDINLNGCLYFTRIALAYLKQKNPENPETNGTGLFSKSLTLISSAAAFQETPGVCAYSASKAGILGLVRSLKAIAPVRVNSICPWATDTKMVTGHAHLFRDAGLPIQTADDVAATVLQVAANPKLHGAAVFVGGGKNIDVEQGFSATESQWLGKYIQNLMAKQAEAFEAKERDWVKSGGD